MEKLLFGRCDKEFKKCPYRVESNCTYHGKGCPQRRCRTKRSTDTIKQGSTVETKTRKQIGDILKWQGFRNSDTGEIDGGYLYILDSFTEKGYLSKGVSIQGVKNRSEAIKKYKANPKNPNNFCYL